MDSFEAFQRGKATIGKEPKVFDWIKAAEIIRDSKVIFASAGLSDDWEWTGGDIFRDGKPLPQNETYTHLASTWAIPELFINGETIECYKMQSETPGWNADTYWPDEALNVLNK